MSNDAAHVNEPLRLLAPAKINLHLRIGKVGDDGFHPLASWMCTVGLFDSLTLQLNDPARREAGGVRGAAEGPLKLTCDDPALPTDAGNLVVRAANAFAAALREGGGGAAAQKSTPGATDWTAVHEAVSRGAIATLQKSIPAGAGLGGGSSDAVSALCGLNRLWVADWGRAALAELAATLGSDLPFFLHAPSAWCTGRGQRVRPVDPPGVARWCALILPPIHMPTPDVYRRFDALQLGDERRIHEVPDLKAWAALESERLMPLLINDLEAPAFDLRPELGRLCDDAGRSLRRTVRMSGSGSSLFTLFDDGPSAMEAAEIISRHYGVRSIAVEISPLTSL